MMVPTSNNNRDFLGLGPGGRHHSVGPGGAAIHAMGQIDTNVTPQQQQAQQQQQHPPADTPTGDLLGFGTQQHQVINVPPHATVSITMPGEAAPSIAGIGRIEPSTQITTNNAQVKPKQKVIVVPTYSCNGGLDTKFNHFARHARPSHLHNLLTPEEYEREIRTLNDKIKKARAKGLDMALLATGALMVPLALWGVRHGNQVKRRRTLIEEGVWEFNERMGMDDRNVRMVWNRAKVVGGGESYLTIEEVEEDRGGRGREKFD